MFEICGEIRKSKNLIKSLYLCFTAAHFVTGLKHFWDLFVENWVHGSSVFYFFKSVISRHWRNITSRICLVFLLWSHEDKLFASYNKLIFLVHEILEILNRKILVQWNPSKPSPLRIRNNIQYRGDSDEKGLFIKELVDWSPHAMLDIEGILMKRGYL